MTEWNATKAQTATRLLELIEMRLISEAIHVVAALGVADLISAAPKSAEQLAEKTGSEAASLSRVLRALVAFNVFSQDPEGRYALAPMGEYLKRETDGSLHSAAMFFGGERGARADELFLHCVRTGESVARKLSGSNWIGWLQSDSEVTALFNAMMTTFSLLHLTGVLEAYNFSQASMIVDVGGGHGRIISEILKKIRKCVVSCSTCLTHSRAAREQSPRPGWPIGATSCQAIFSYRFLLALMLICFRV